MGQKVFGWDAYENAKEWAAKYKKPIFGAGGTGSAYFGGEGRSTDEYAAGTRWGDQDIGGKVAAYHDGEWHFGEQGSLIPGFQKGGIVPGPKGKGMLAMVHGGETIIPAGATTNNNNNNQKTFNIQINSNLSAADIVKDIDLIDSMNTSAYSTVLG
jgi:hypothetical protein